VSLLAGGVTALSCDAVCTVAARRIATAWRDYLSWRWVVQAASGLHVQDPPQVPPALPRVHASHAASARSDKGAAAPSPPPLTSTPSVPPLQLAGITASNSFPGPVASSLVSKTDKPTITPPPPRGASPIPAPHSTPEPPGSGKGGEETPRISIRDLSSGSETPPLDSPSGKQVPILTAADSSGSREASLCSLDTSVSSTDDAPCKSPRLVVAPKSGGAAPAAALDSTAGAWVHQLQLFVPRALPKPVQEALDGKSGVVVHYTFPPVSVHAASTCITRVSPAPQSAAAAAPRPSAQAATGKSNPWSSPGAIGAVTHDVIQRLGTAKLRRALGAHVALTPPGGLAGTASMWVSAEQGSENSNSVHTFQVLGGKVATIAPQVLRDGTLAEHATAQAWGTGPQQCLLAAAALGGQQEHLTALVMLLRTGTDSCAVEQASDPVPAAKSLMAAVPGALLGNLVTQAWAEAGGASTSPLPAADGSDSLLASSLVADGSIVQRSGICAVQQASLLLRHPFAQCQGGECSLPLTLLYRASWVHLQRIHKAAE